MIGGIIAGAGALIGGSMIASSNREASMRAFAASDNFRRTYDARGIENAQAIKKVGKNIADLNDTFDDEFNNRQKRLIQIKLVDEDDEPVKLSEYFSQVPVFKEHLKNAFYSETKQAHRKWHDDRYNEEIYAQIQSMPNIKEALELLQNVITYNYSVIPHKIYNDFFMDDSIISDIHGHEKIIHKGYNIIYAHFCGDFTERVKKYYEDQLKRLNGQIAIYKGQDRIPYGLEHEKSELEWILYDWDPLNDPTTLKYFKKFDDLVDKTREYALEMLMCAQERELRRTVKSYLKPDISFELSDLDYSGENAIFTLKKEDNEAYLIIRIAPNVHVTDKEGF